MKPFKLSGTAIVSLVALIALAFSVVAATQNLAYDSFNNATNISYDGLNRILVKNFSSDQHNYTYDVDYFGTLANVSFANGSVAYEYDDKFRVMSVTKQKQVIHV